jgi:Zn-finger nucleic acid-binding protein
MNCPACGHALTPVDVADVAIDVCQAGCAGMWFDQGELRLFDDSSERAGQVLIEVAGESHVAIDATLRRRCPRCPNSVLMRHFFSAQRAVTVDECPTCGGVWSDAGELDRIRREYSTEAARRQAAGVALEEALAPARMALMDAELQEQLPYDTFRSRVLSSLIIACYLAVAFKLSGTGLTLKMLYRSVVPWVCVCFPDALGGALSPILGTTRKSPRSFVWFFGWLVLLLPIIQIAIVWLEISGSIKMSR